MLSTYRGSPNALSTLTDLLVDLSARQKLSDKHLTADAKKRRSVNRTDKYCCRPPTQKSADSRQLSACSTDVVVPATRRSSLGDRAFPVAVARAWKALPPSVTSWPVSLLIPATSEKLFSSSEHCTDNIIQIWTAVECNGAIYCTVVTSFCSRPKLLLKPHICFYFIPLFRRRNLRCNMT